MCLVGGYPADTPADVLVQLPHLLAADTELHLQAGCLKFASLKIVSTDAGHKLDAMNWAKLLTLIQAKVSGFKE